MTVNHSDPVLGSDIFRIRSGHLHRGEDGDEITTTVYAQDPGKHRRPGSALIGWAGWLLAALGTGLLFVSFAGQYKYIFAARQQKIASGLPIISVSQWSSKESISLHPEVSLLLTKKSLIFSHGCQSGKYCPE